MISKAALSGIKICAKIALTYSDTSNAPFSSAALYHIMIATIYEIIVQTKPPMNHPVISGLGIFKKVTIKHIV